VQIEVLASPRQAGAVGQQRYLAQHVSADVVKHAVLAPDVERRAALPAWLAMLVGGHQDLPAVGGSARDGCLVVLRHVVRIGTGRASSRTIDLGSGVSLDITHAFPIASTLASALGAGDPK
jgi:hypothetical protein